MFKKKEKSIFNTTQTQTKIEDFIFILKKNYEINFNITYSLNNEENNKKEINQISLNPFFENENINEKEFNEDKQINISDIDFNNNELSNNNNNNNLINNISSKEYAKKFCF